MENAVHKDIIALVERSQNILLCTHRKPDGDAIGSIMALYKALKLLGKNVTAACADQVPESFSFMPEADQVTQEIGAGRDFVITLDCENTEVDRLKYHLEDNKIHIVVTPKAGRFWSKNVSCTEDGGSYDLIMTVDVADIPQLGKLYEDNADLFQTLPVVNIDHHVSNSEFGKINHIDPSSSSTAEMLYRLIQEMEKHFSKQLIVPDTATFLLSGVATDTGSFQNANTTPRSMEIAANLMEAGANQHDVIKYLFRTKKLSTLKLWGKILSKIDADDKHRLVWSTITQQDLRESGADLDQAGDIIDELLVHAPEAEIVALFKEDQDMVSVSLRSKTPQANVMEIAQKFGGGGHVQASGIKFPGRGLQEIMTQVLAELQLRQRQRLGLEETTDTAPAQQTEPVTQVLEGYTTPAQPPSPTLEQRAEDQTPAAPAAPAPGAEASAPPVQPVQTPLQTAAQNIPEAPPAPTVPAAPAAPAPTPAPTTPPAGKTDIHDQTRAAITAEQSQDPGKSFTPSQEARPGTKPTPPKRFNEPVPDYLKNKPAAKTPPAPASTTADVPPTETAPSTPPAGGSGGSSTGDNDDGVTVTYGQTTPTPPAPPVPADSTEPVVKQVTPPPAAPQAPTAPTPPAPPAPPTPPAAPTGMGAVGQQKPGAQNPASSSQQPPAKPQPPKDPFALGDDGLTDIERALGGL